MDYSKKSEGKKKKKQNEANQRGGRHPRSRPPAAVAAASTPPLHDHAPRRLGHGHASPTPAPPRRSHARREAREPPGRGRGLNLPPHPRSPSPRRRRPPRGPPSPYSTHFVLRLCPNPHQQVEPQFKFPSPFREREPILLAAEALAGGGGSELGYSQSRTTLLVIRAEWAVV